ncbi:MAG TPA: HEAT repeat domain-containing protein [Gemmataceae bacterium]|nr:HEAT repeat domain-containing protein [Gemmataceae bacterium]
MLPRYLVLSPLVVLLTMSASASAAGDEPESAADEEALRTAHYPTDGPGLLELFHKRTLDDDKLAHIKALIVQLGSVSFALREEASTELVSIGSGAAALLRQAARHADLEIRWRARRALSDIQHDSDAEVVISAVRVLGRRKPVKTAEVLLAYLPSAEDPRITDEVCVTLASVAVRQGKANPILVQALTDREAVKRGAAGAALAAAGCREQFSTVRRLLHDRDAFVRQRVATALLVAHDKSAVPALIALLTELPLADAERVEDLLVLLAGEKTPHGDLEGGAAARRKYREAWAAWWTRQGDELDLAKIEGLGRPLGHTLIAQVGAGGEGSLQAIDPRGRKRWHIDGLQYPIDAQVIDAQRVLITEYTGRRVTERDHKGKILWQTQVDSSPVSARRLPNGNIFIATRTRIYEVDRKGSEVWTLNAPLGRFSAACPLRDGSIGVISTTGEFQHLDREGKVLKSFRVGRVGRSLGMQIQALPNGHVLVPHYTANSVVEYDSDGKVIWTAQAHRPTCVRRLPNGHTLISSRLSSVVVELDRKGQEVWSHRCEGRPTSVHRR